MKLREWQEKRLYELEDATFSQSKYAEDVTILIYTFPQKGREDEMFQWIKCSILHTWSLLGQMRTVIVANTEFAAVRNFAAKYQEVVEVQIAPNVVPGNIKTMSIDCIKNLHSRFSTPYCLVIQDDGFPLKDNLGDFLSKYDFIGAPIISDGWKRTLAYSIGLGSFNGGFSLRSKRLCEYASKLWYSFFSKFMPENHKHLGEDFYYTTLLKFIPATWFKFRFPSEAQAAAFALDGLSGHISISFNAKPFGCHGPYTFEKLHEDPLEQVTVLAYHFWRKAGYEEAFAKVGHAFEETWKHCGRLKSVLVVNETAPCVERFAAKNPNLKVQIEPFLEPGNIFTMSADMNGRLHARFTTPYVLIIQNDGYPLRPGLEEFVGTYDFIGAPYVGLQWWKQLIAKFFNYHVQNGGFSLRSHAICEAVAKYWNEKYHRLGDCNATSEDIFYTSTLVKKERSYRRRFRLATSRESLKFSWDAIVPIPMPNHLPFGFHGMKSHKQLRTDKEN